MMRRETGFLVAAIPACFLPASYVVLVIHVIVSIVRGAEIRPDEGGWLWWISTIAIWMTVIQWPFYLLWVAVSTELSFRQKAGWGVVIFLLNMFAMPYFLWCKFRRTTVSGLLAIIGRQRLRDHLE